MTDGTVSRESVSRRTFLKVSATSGSTIFLGSIVGKATALVAQAVITHDEAVRMVAPSEATVLTGFLAAKLQWEYAAGEAPHNIILTVAPKHAREHPVVQVTLDGAVTTYALPLIPNETYVWQLQPMDEQGRSDRCCGRGGRSARDRSALCRTPLRRRCTRIPARTRAILRSIRCPSGRRSRCRRGTT